LRKIVVTGLVAVAAVLGSWGAVSVASAGTSAAPAAASAPSGSAGVAATPLTRVGHGATPGMPAAAHALAYPAGVTPAATAAPLDALEDVACPSQGNCLAVGANFTANAGHGSPRSYHWNGSAWAPVSVPLPSSTTGGFLDSVSCSGGACIAVGDFFRGSTEYLLSEIWNGSGWTVSLPPFITGSKFPFLGIVSCASATYCVGAGSYTPTSNTQDEIALAEVWNGTSWKAFTAPSPGPFNFTEFGGVSCPSTTFCLLSGMYESSRAGFLTDLVDSFNGSTFTRLTDAALTPQNGYATFLNNISCSAPTACAAVGEQAKAGAAFWSGFAETYNGSTWSRAVLGLPTTIATQLDSISCATGTSCVAVGGAGSYANATTGKAIFSVWNGSTWKLHYADPPAGQGNILLGDKCLAANYCIATGTEGTYNTNTGHGLTWFWNGGSFTLVNTP
jgi:hypothetical protein